MSRTSHALLVLAISLVPAAVAAQELDPVGTVTPPPGWTIDQGRSAGLEKIVAMEDHFGAVPVHVSAQHLRAPTPGAILVTSQVMTDTLPPEPGAAATAELHQVRAGIESMGATAKVVRWDVATDAGARTTEGRLEWHDPSLGTTALSRTIVFQLRAPRAALVRLSAECILADDAGAHRTACEAALASLAPRGPVADRELLAVSAAAPAAILPGHADGPPAAAPPPAMRAHDGRPIPTTVVVTAPKQAPDRRPYYMMAGIAVIALVYWWNKREKARLAGADGTDGTDGTSGSGGRDRPPADEAGDGKAGDGARTDGTRTDGGKEDR